MTHPKATLPHLISATVAPLGLLLAVTADAAVTNLISLGTGGSPLPMCTGDDFCYSVTPSISADGQVIAFTSVVDNIVDGPSAGGIEQVLLHNRMACTTVRISESPAGQPGTLPSNDPAISADGEVVTFTSTAINLLDADGLEEFTGQVYLYTIANDTLELISANTDGVAGNETSSVAIVSGNGRYVIFQSSATNLVPGDTNGQPDIFLYDRESEAMQRISVNEAGVEGDSASRRPYISSNGRFITFDSLAENFTDIAISGYQAYLYDRDADDDGVFDEEGQTSLTLVSVNDRGEPADSSAFWPVPSHDGTRVAFTSTASNLVDDFTNGDSDIYLRDLSTGQTTVESVGPNGEQTIGGSFFPLRFSGDDRYLTFHSAAMQLIEGGHNGSTHIFRRDLLTSENIIISRNSDGELADQSSEHADISATGDIIAFGSAGNNMIPGGSANPNWVNTYVRTLRPADIDGNGTVNGADLGVLLSEWGEDDCSTADLNEDGLIDGADLSQLLSAWGR